MGWFDFLNRKKETEKQIRELVVRAGRQQGKAEEAKTLERLGNVYSSIGRHARAAETYETAAKIDEKYGDGIFSSDYMGMARREREKTAIPEKRRAIAAAGFIMIISGIIISSFQITGFAISDFNESQFGIIGVVLLVFGLVVLLYSKNKKQQ